MITPPLATRSPASPSALDLVHVALDGTTLVEASAGTGKTHTIATLFVRLLLEKGYEVSQILVVTYTRAATAELRLRIRRRLAEALEIFQRFAADQPAPPDADLVLAALAARAAASGTLSRGAHRLEESLRAFDEASIFTIHGFCQRVLASYTFESGAAFDLELQEDDHLLVTEVVQDYWSSQLHESSELFFGHLRARKTTIAKLISLVERTSQNPDLSLVPAAAPRASDALEASYEAARLRVSQLWREHGPLLTATLTDGRFRATSYKREQIEREWSPALLDLQCAPAALPKWFSKLTPACFAPLKGKVAPQHPFFDACAELCAAAEALAAALDSQLTAFRHGLIDYARRELAARKAQLGTVGFDDLLLQLRAAVRSAAGESLVGRLREAHPAALIDEFQDTDPVQAEIFQRIYDPERPEPGTLLLVGDPKQAIYAFRGADIFAYLQAAESAHTHTLPVNYRSDPSLLQALNALWTRAARPFVFPQIHYHAVSAPKGARDELGGALAGRAGLEILFATRQALGQSEDKPVAKGQLEAPIPALIADQIVELLQAGATIAGEPIAPRHVAVLCRTNRQAQRVQAALRRAQVPAVLDGDASVFDSELAPELTRVIAALAEPGDAGRLRAALATSLLDVSGNELLALEKDEREWDRWASLFHELCELWQTRGFIRCVHTLFDRCEVPQRLLVRADGERRYTDLMHLVELLHEEAVRSRKGPLALLEWFQRMCQGEAERTTLVAADVQIRLESDTRAVTLTTIHKSKGLEYPIVYCPFLWDGSLLRGNDKDHPRFHDQAHAGRLTLDLGCEAAGPAEAHTRQAESEAMAEELRLLYVALSRAEHRVSVVWGAFSDAHLSALGYLLHQPLIRASMTAAEDLPAATQARVKALSDAELRADLSALAQAAAGAIELRDVVLREPRQYALAGGPALPLQARLPGRLPADVLRTSSFSRLISERTERGFEVAASVSLIDGLDRDESAGVAPLEPAVGEPVRVRLADFPAGASFGHLVHEIYEQIDFRASLPDVILPVVQATLAAYAQKDAPADTLAQAIHDSLVTPLSAAGEGLPSLSVVAPEARVCELEFVFPVKEPAPLPVAGSVAARAAARPTRKRAAAAGQLELFASAPEPAGDAPPRAPSPAIQTFSARGLAALLAREARSATERAYVAKLDSLGFGPVAGFVRGFMDLVVEHEGRYYLLDYKSNHLGDLPGDYAAERLSAVMIQHHYVLQALIYSVALHRYLRGRIAGYEYEQQFGGVYYLFIRGMHPDHPPGTGVFAERPSAGLIAALDAVLGEAPRT
jgi:exodeoxyribonuclease V beta subunit